MEVKIKEVHDYFKNKIVAGDYEVVEYSQQTMTILVDGYTFTLWLSNGSNWFTTYNGAINFMEIDFTEGDEKDSAYSVAKVHHNKFIREELIEEKQKELDRLKKEVE